MNGRETQNGTTKCSTPKVKISTRHFVSLSHLPAAKRASKVARASCLSSRRQEMRGEKPRKVRQAKGNLVEKSFFFFLYAHTSQACAGWYVLYGCQLRLCVFSKGINLPTFISRAAALARETSPRGSLIASPIPPAGTKKSYRRR